MSKPQRKPVPQAPPPDEGPPKKRRPERLKDVTEPPLTPVRGLWFAQGVSLFDRGSWWEAHEAWETAWKDLGDDPKDDAEFVLRGLIQLAAALHAHKAGRQKGARSNLDKAQKKLAAYKGRFWGVDVDAVNQALASANDRPARLTDLHLGISAP
jgi:uncharacterized protein